MRKRGLAGSLALYILAFLLIGGVIAGSVYLYLNANPKNFECETDGLLKCKEANLVGPLDLTVEGNYLLLEIPGGGTISSAGVSESFLSSEQCNPIIDEQSISKSGGKTIKIIFDCSENLT